MSVQDLSHADAPRERHGLIGAMVRLNRFLLVLLVIPAAWIYFKPPVKDQEQARSELKKVEAQRDELHSQAAVLEQKLQYIKEDPEYLEAMARDRLHLQKDGEVILRLEETEGK